MKKTVTLAVATAALLAMLAGCATTGGAATPGAAEPSLADANPKKSTENFTDEMKIPYAIDLSPDDGADSVETMRTPPTLHIRTSTIWSPPTPSRS